MEKPFKFVLPSPNFNKEAKNAGKVKPYFLTPSGMTLLPREKQPPPMYGKRGATVPARFLQPVAQTEPLPEPVKQYCESCELELQSFEDFKRHRAQHEKCPVEGCQYRGHPSVMDKHVTALHSSGLFDKFKKLCTPEEIAAWREERRKRYPTVANVLMKQKAQEQRQKRGERLENNKSRFGRQNDRKRALPNNESKIHEDKVASETNENKTQPNKNKNKKKKRSNQHKREHKETTETNKQTSERSEEEEIYPCPMFGGTLGMRDYKHFNDKKETPSSNALFGLVGMYGSGDESEEQYSDHDSDAITTQKDSYTQNIEVRETVDISGTVNNFNNKATGQEIETCELQNKKESTSNQGYVGNENSAEHIIDEENIKDIAVKNSPSCTINDDSHNKCPEESYIENGVTCDTIISASQKQLTESCTPNAAIQPNSSDEGPEETAIQRSIPEYKVKAEKPSTSSNTTPKPHPQNSSKNYLKQTEQHTKEKQTNKRKSGLDYRKLKVRKQNTMLEKLLESDIRHERNVLLQCVRYVCESNFFGVDKTTTSTGKCKTLG